MRTIAMVEDNSDNRLLVEAMLEDLYAVTSYASGKEALEGMRKDVPALVLLDISLPGMGGPEILELMRQDPTLKGVPAVALTAHAMEGDQERFLQMGFDGYLSKPIVDDEALIALIQDLLERDPTS